MISKIGFESKHHEFYGIWQGLGIQAYYRCDYHGKKNELEISFQGDSNSNLPPPSQEESDSDG